MLTIDSKLDVLKHDTKASNEILPIGLVPSNPSMPVIVLPCTSLREVVSLVCPELQKWIMDGSGSILFVYGIFMCFGRQNAIVF